MGQILQRIAQILVSVALWVPVYALVLIAVLLGPLVVAIGIWMGHVPKLYRHDPAQNRPNTWWEMAMRNPVGGLKFLLNHPKHYFSYGSVQEPTKDGPRLQARFNIHSWMASLRVVWRYSKKHYGEFYLGWKLGSERPNLDFGMSFPPICRWWATIGN